MQSSEGVASPRNRLLEIFFLKCNKSRNILMNLTRGGWRDSRSSASITLVLRSPMKKRFHLGRGLKITWVSSGSNCNISVTLSLNPLGELLQTQHKQPKTDGNINVNSNCTHSVKTPYLKLSLVSIRKFQSKRRPSSRIVSPGISSNCFPNRIRLRFWSPYLNRHQDKH